jgi:hypothetical protein
MEQSIIFPSPQRTLYLLPVDFKTIPFSNIVYLP